MPKVLHSIEHIEAPSTNSADDARLDVFGVGGWGCIFWDGCTANNTQYSCVGHAFLSNSFPQAIVLSKIVEIYLDTTVLCKNVFGKNNCLTASYTPYCGAYISQASVTNFCCREGRGYWHARRHMSGARARTAVQHTKSIG